MYAQPAPIKRYGFFSSGHLAIIPTAVAWDFIADNVPVCACMYMLKAASEAADRTSQMKARAGRASYVSADLLKNPDAGAKACVVWLSAIFAAFAKSASA